MDIEKNFLNQESAITIWIVNIDTFVEKKMADNSSDFQPDENAASVVDATMESDIFAQRVTRVKEMIANGEKPFGERFDGVTKIHDVRSAYNPEIPEELLRVREDSQSLPT